MWIVRSLFVWTYAIATLYSCVTARQRSRIVTLLLVLVLRLGVLHTVTLPYSSRPFALSALKSRMFQWATLGTLISAAAVDMMALFAAVCCTIPSWRRWSGVTADGEPQGFIKFITAQIDAFTERYRAGTTSKLEEYGIGSVFYSLLEVIPTILTWILTRGYGTMLIFERDSQSFVEAARVHDVVAYALVGAFALGIGQDSLNALHAGWNVLRGRAPNPEDEEGKSFSLLNFANDILAPILDLAGPFIVATAVAERHVLRLPTRMSPVLFLVWAANFGGRVPRTVLASTAAYRTHGRPSRVYLLCALLLVEVATVVVFGEMCWRRYRTAIGVEASYEGMHQNAHILSAPICAARL